MCEIFSIIGGTVLGSLGITGASTAAATSVGVAATAATVGSLASTGIGIANSVRAANEISNQNKGYRDAIKSSQEQKVNVTSSTGKTASQLEENPVQKRAISSLRIPLTKTANTIQQVNTTTANTGLNIPT